MTTEPSAGAFDIALRDGRSLTVRRADPGDERPLCALYDRLDATDRALRFFSAGADLRRMARDAVCDAPGGRRDLVAVAPDGDELVAHACWVRSGPATAEVAFVVDRALRGEGVATALLALLAHDARTAGIDRLTAVVLSENRPMLEVFRDSGFEPVLRARAAVRSPA